MWVAGYIIVYILDYRYCNCIATHIREICCFTNDCYCSVLEGVRLHSVEGNTSVTLAPLTSTSDSHPQLVYRKDREEALKGFTPVADTVSSRQASQASRLASNIGYSMAPHEQERAPPQPYNRELVWGRGGGV